MQHLNLLCLTLLATASLAQLPPRPIPTPTENIYPNGTTQITYPDGTIKITNPDGSLRKLTHPDGTGMEAIWYEDKRPACVKISSQQLKECLKEMNATAWSMSKTI